jgi:dipeptidyl aminopeptidase/acylaminoacyl peptidase
MTDDRSLERAARSFLEPGPTRAPEAAIEAALRLVETTPQERDLRIPRRFALMSMPARVAAAAAIGVLAVGGAMFGASLISIGDHAAPPCPDTQREADAVDTFAAGLTPAQRAWGTPPSVSSRTRPGGIAVFAADIGDGPGVVDLLDPATGRRCRLVQLLANYPVQGPSVTTLDWSPSGDALAIGLGGVEGPEGQADGQVLVWMPTRLLRVWSGEGTPRVEWAPDGRSVVIWSSTSLGSSQPETRLIHADGSPDRLFAVRPWVSALRWSPDGTRWAVAELDETGKESRVSVVTVADGEMTPIELGTMNLDLGSWLDDGRLLLFEWKWGVGHLRYLDVPIAAPANHTDIATRGDLSGWDPVLSPDRARLAYLTGALDGPDLKVIGLSGNEPRAPLPIASGRKVGPVGLAWSPDGTQLVFHADGAIWIAAPDGSATRRLNAAGVVLVDDPWQPVPVR